MVFGHFHGFGRAEIEPIPVGGEGREGLEAVFPLGEGAPGNLFASDVIDHDVGSHVIHFDAVVSVIVERLEGLVHGESDVVSGRMPVRVHQGAYGGIGFGVQLFDRIPVDEHRAAVGGPHMENALGRVSACGGMAVHAVSVRQVVGQDGGLSVACQVPLVDTHLLPALIARRNEPVREIRVNCFLDINLERLVGLPCFSLAHQNGHFHFFLLHHLFPQPLRQGEQAVFSTDCPAFHLQGAFPVPGIGEIERSDVAGNRHKTVVRFHGRKAADASGRMDIPGTASKQKRSCHQADAKIFSHISLYNK